MEVNDEINNRMKRSPSRIVPTSAPLKVKLIRPEGATVQRDASAVHPTVSGATDAIVDPFGREKILTRSLTTRLLPPPPNTGAQVARSKRIPVSIRLWYTAN